MLFRSILDLKSILTAGFNCVLHVHAAIEEVTFSALLHKVQKGTGRKSKVAPTHAKRGESIIARLQVTGGAGSVCVERFEDYPQMGRFTLRDQVCVSPMCVSGPLLMMETGTNHCHWQDHQADHRQQCLVAMPVG